MKHIFALDDPYNDVLGPTTRGREGGQHQDSSSPLLYWADIIKLVINKSNQEILGWAEACC